MADFDVIFIGDSMPYMITHTSHDATEVLSSGGDAGHQRQAGLKESV